MGLTGEGLKDRIGEWMAKKPEAYQPVRSTPQEHKGFSPVTDTDHVEWGPELGRRVDGEHIIVGVYDDMDPLVMQVYFKGNTPAIRHLNVMADQAVADAILEVLKKRYPPASYKIEYYGQKEYQKTDNPIEIDLVDDRLKRLVSRFCMCCVLQESHFAGGVKHRNETVALIDKAMQGMDG